MQSPQIPKPRKNWKRWLALVPVAIAALIVVLLMRTRSGPLEKPADEIGIPLRVITVPVVNLIPRASGHGLAEPAQVWQAVAQVKGSAVFVSHLLDAGMLVQKGTLLVKIDPSDYELAVARLEAAIGEAEARLAELDAEELHLAASVKIEKASLTLAEASLNRKRNAQASGAITPDEVDREARTVLQQQQSIQQLENTLGLLPSRRKALVAALASHAANLQQAKLNLSRTVVEAPFECRLAAVNIEQGQFVSAGQTMFEAHGAAAVEVEAKFRPEQLRNLLSDEKRQSLEAGLTMETLRDVFDLKVTVRVHSGDWVAVWPARFDRIREIVDPRTRAINVIALVDDPYKKVVPGIRPALMRGMYCEMELIAPARPDSVVLPRSAVHGDHVYLMDADGRLRERKVRIAFTQGEIASIASGLTGGESVIVSDPTPAIEGMKVDATPDAALQHALVADAQNEAGAE
ncbi:MAG: efflux RND transporter periplasmic adaptor subunit [Kiritimatiellia bacterium]